MQTTSDLRVIYVDDEPTALENLKYTLKSQQNIASLQLFSTPIEALNYAAQNTIDFAFLDIDLYGMSGFELYEKLKALQPSIKFAFMTGNYIYMKKSNKIIQAPYIFKPYNEEDITAVLYK